MWFAISIIERLTEAQDWFWDAYLEVRDWIFPFYFLWPPLYGLYVAFFYLVYAWDAFSRWLTWANNMIVAFPTTWTFWVYFEEWLMAGWNAWEWVINAIGNVWSIIDNWWSATSSDVLGWIEQTWQNTLYWLNDLQGQVNELRVLIQDLPGAIPDLSVILEWFTNWTGNVTSVINTWWTSTMGEVQELINSAFIVRSDFWAGWQEIRDQVTEFFTDPEDWLYKAADRIIERFW